MECSCWKEIVAIEAFEESLDCFDLDVHVELARDHFHGHLSQELVEWMNLNLQVKSVVSWK